MVLSISTSGSEASSAAKVKVLSDDTLEFEDVRRVGTLRFVSRSLMSS